MIDFGSNDWASALVEGLGARVQRLPDSGLLACFRAGPFQVAYPDFLCGSGSLSAEGLGSRVDAAKYFKADLMRLQTDAPPVDSREYARHVLGSVAIAPLGDWVERNWEKARRAGNRQSRSELRIRRGRAGDGVHLHRLYLSTMRRHSGAVRYSQDYFERIAPPAALVAEADGMIVGFVCVGFRGACAYYMHGAHAPQARAYYPSDQLFLAMLRGARDANMTSFDFLPSPVGQDSLAAYKRAWGGQDVPLTVSDLALNPVRARAFSLALGWSRRIASIRWR